MKRFYFLAILLLGLLLPSCKQDAEEPVDCDSPVIYFKIIATDIDGNQIIQKEGGEEAIKEILSIEYLGHTSTVRKKGDPYNEKFLGTGKFGAIYTLSPFISYTDNKPETILFGRFIPEHNYKDETFTLIWSDGTRDVVKFSTNVSYKNKKYNYNCNATINGLPFEWEDPYTPIIRKTIK